MKKLIFLFMLLFVFIKTAQADVTLKINIPNEKVTVIINNIATYLNYQSEYFDPNVGEIVQNPLSKKDTVLLNLKKHVETMNEAGRIMVATEAARQQAIEDAATDTEGITVE
jgi:hypothetical protein